MHMEIKWGCGCFEEDGVLKVACTQEKTATGDHGFSAEHLATAHPYSPICYRLRALEAKHKAEGTATEAPEPAATEGEASNGV